MESTAKGIADAIGRDLDWLAAALARWLAAAEISIGATDCREILCDLREWLLGEGSATGAQKLLGEPRANQLARSFVNEHLKSGVKWAEEWDGLLDQFFAVGPPIAGHDARAPRMRDGLPKTTRLRGKTPRRGAFDPDGESK